MKRVVVAVTLIIAYYLLVRLFNPSDRNSILLIPADGVSPTVSSPVTVTSISDAGVFSVSQGQVSLDRAGNCQTIAWPHAWFGG